MPVYSVPGLIVSIHAPARGATPAVVLLRSILPKFQFTPLREGRLHRLHRHRCQHWRFNSRPCERGDPEKTPKIDSDHLFQFTPLREGRPILPHIVP